MSALINRITKRSLGRDMLQQSKVTTSSHARTPCTICWLHGSCRLASLVRTRSAHGPTKCFLPRNRCRELLRPTFPNDYRAILLRPQQDRMTTTLSISSMNPPPSEISSLARLCFAGDIIANDDINLAFHSEFETYLKHGHRSVDLWPVLLTAIQHKRPGIIALLLSRGLQLNSMYVYEAVATRSKEVFDAFLKSGWDLNKPLSTFDPPVLA